MSGFSEDSIIYQGMPTLATPLMDEGGRMNQVWYRFFLNLLVKSGMHPTAPIPQGNRVGVNGSGHRVKTMILYPGGPNVSCAYYSPDATHGFLNVYDVQTGLMVGFITIDNWIGNP